MTRGSPYEAVRLSLLWRGLDQIGCLLSFGLARIETIITVCSWYVWYASKFSLWVLVVRVLSCTGLSLCTSVCHSELIGSNICVTLPHTR